MAIPTVTNDTTFYNINECRSFNQTIGSSLTRLSSQPCSEVIIYNRTLSNITVYDNSYSSAASGFLLSAGENFTFRGITNTNQVSAIAVSPGLVYYRTQYFSNNPVRY